ncbi:MAG: GlsB/YeaQ/YmgE family stress response membrane protein [Gemmataceae bacterium]|nr:GlsB/YeaQ/YmgE family stress response membrane protein [Gemmataceae bacterium]
MSPLDLVLVLVIAGICGSLGQAIGGYSGGGCLVSIVLGFIGALIGVYLARLLELPILWAPEGFPVVWSVLGAALFVAFINLLRRPRRRD